MNSVALIGRLTADPTAHAGEKHESATFRLAVPRPGSDGADFVDIVTFDKLADRAALGEYRKAELTRYRGGHLSDGVTAPVHCPTERKILRRPTTTSTKNLDGSPLNWTTPTGSSPS